MAIHAMTMIAAAPKGRHPVRSLARSLRVSEAHLAKVLQRLAKVGIATSTRGPAGGYTLGGRGGGITLLEIVEAIEGPLQSIDCLMPVKTCSGGTCIFGDLLDSVNRRFREYLSGTTIGELSTVFE
jgi:Rrf2 family protein